MPQVKGPAISRSWPDCVTANARADGSPCGHKPTNHTRGYTPGDIAYTACRFCPGCGVYRAGVDARPVYNP